MTEELRVINSRDLSDGRNDFDGPVRITGGTVWKERPLKEPIAIHSTAAVEAEGPLENVSITAASITVEDRVGCQVRLVAEQGDVTITGLLMDNAQIVSNQGNVVINGDVLVIGGASIEAEGDITITGKVYRLREKEYAGEGIKPMRVISHNGNIIFAGDVDTVEALAEEGEVKVTGQQRECQLISGRRPGGRGL